jgi:hypothetical protein
MSDEESEEEEEATREDMEDAADVNAGVDDHEHEDADMGGDLGAGEGGEGNEKGSVAEGGLPKAPLIHSVTK